MKLLEDINRFNKRYKLFLDKIENKIKLFELEIKNESRLGLFEELKYTPSGEVIFEPQHDVARPVKTAGEERAISNRIHIIYNPSTSRVVDLIKTGPKETPGDQFVRADATLLQGAIKHIGRLNPKIAQKIKSGLVQVWIPREQLLLPQFQQHVNKQPQSSKISRVDMSPERLERARIAADKLTFTK